MSFSGRETTNKGFPTGWRPGADDQDAQRVLRTTLLLEALVFSSWAWDRFNTSRLKYAYRGGVIDSGAAWVVKANSTITLVDDATNFVQRTDQGVVSVNQMDFTYPAQIPMAQVTTQAGQITNVIDRRPEIGGAPEGSTGSITFPEIVGIILDSQVPLSAVKQWESFLDINASQIVGIIDRANLPPEIAYEDEANTFSELQTIPLLEAPNLEALLRFVGNSNR